MEENPKNKKLATFNKLRSLLGMESGQPEEEDPFEAAKRRNMARQEMQNQKVREQVDRLSSPGKAWMTAPSEPQFNPTYIGKEAGDALAETQKQYREQVVPQERQKEVNMWKEKFPSLFNWFGGDSGEQS